jgi:hypothetical protein
MRQQLRLRVLLPVALLGLLGAGFGAYATGRPPADEPPPVPPPAPTQVEKPAGKEGKAVKRKTEAAGVKKARARKAAPPALSPAERALRGSSVAVIVFYTPHGGVDNVAIREARAAAVDMEAGFVALNVKLGGTVAKLARDYDVFAAPAVLVLKRGPKVATRLDGYADRETVAQAVADALR